MVNTLVYWAGRPIGMRREATLGPRAQAALLSIALVLFMALATQRALQYRQDGMAIPVQGPQLAATHRHVAALPPLKLRGDYRQTFALPPIYPYSQQIRRVARRFNLPADLVAGVVRTESQFNPRCLSPVGAEGLMQLMPSTAWLMARRLGWHHFDLFNPADNLTLGTYFLKDLLNQYGDLPTALSYYNAGQWGIVSRGVYRNRGYIRAVLRHYHDYGAEHQAMLTVKPVLARLEIRPILAAE